MVDASAWCNQLNVRGIKQVVLAIFLGINNTEMMVSMIFQLDLTYGTGLVVKEKFCKLEVFE
jgi:hypothetical protein